MGPSGVGVRVWGRGAQVREAGSDAGADRPRLAPCSSVCPQVLKKTFQAALAWLGNTPEMAGCCDLDPPTQLFLGGDWSFGGEGISQGCLLTHTAAPGERRDCGRGSQGCSLTLSPAGLLRVLQKRLCSPSWEVRDSGLEFLSQATQRLGGEGRGPGQGGTGRGGALGGEGPWKGRGYGPLLTCCASDPQDRPASNRRS